MKISLFAPHQDDEIISSFNYLSSCSEKDDITIIFATNGDYHGKAIAKTRFFESVEALKLCGVPLEKIYYMGYADTGMCISHSFLYQLFRSDGNSILNSKSSNHTYHPANRTTVHSILYGKEAHYTKNNFVRDLQGIVRYLSPDLIIIPSAYDYHGDHTALSYFFKRYVLQHYPIQTYCYLVHSANDFLWPPRDTNDWAKPELLPEIQWQKRKRIILNQNSTEKKKQAILCFQSQMPTSHQNYLLSFAKAEEFFLYI